MCSEYPTFEALPARQLDDEFNVDGKLDPGIAYYVNVLRAAGIETCQSCEGGEGHSYPEPTVEFLGNCNAGYRALSAALDAGLPVDELRRFWSIEDGEPVGPYWAMTFFAPADIIASATSD